MYVNHDNRWLWYISSVMQFTYHVVSLSFPIMDFNTRKSCVSDHITSELKLTDDQNNEQQQAVVIVYR